MSDIAPVGRLSIIGLGPGRADWRTPEVTERLAAATDLVGYRTYLDMLPDEFTATRHRSGNRVEADRSCAALDLAAEGKQVVVVSSGDPGVFAMASAVLEQLDTHPGRWDDVAVEVCPGITAAQGLASQVGAPLGHDFCILSLSDVLKPWEVITRRIALACEADLVMAWYNPRSAHRPHQLGEAIKVVRQHRSPDTVVLYGRQVGRDGQDITVTTLGEFTPEPIDMSTVIIIGSTTTTVIPNRPLASSVYTSRSYPSDAQLPD